VKFVTVVFTIGFAITMANEWANILGGITIGTPANNANGNVTDVKALKISIAYSMASFSLLYIIRVLPSLFMGVLNGNSGSADGNQAEYQAQNVGRTFASGGRSFRIQQTGAKSGFPPGSTLS
jgi:hypothetical protein